MNKKTAQLKNFIDGGSFDLNGVYRDKKRPGRCDSEMFELTVSEAFVSSTIEIRLEPQNFIFTANGLDNLSNILKNLAEAMRRQEQ